MRTLRYSLNFFFHDIFALLIILLFTFVLWLPLIKITNSSYKDIYTFYPENAKITLIPESVDLGSIINSPLLFREGVLREDAIPWYDIFPEISFFESEKKVSFPEPNSPVNLERIITSFPSYQIFPYKVKLPRFFSSRDPTVNRMDIKITVENGEMDISSIAEKLRVGLSGNFLFIGSVVMFENMDLRPVIVECTKGMEQHQIRFTVNFLRRADIKAKYGNMVKVIIEGVTK